MSLGLNTTYNRTYAHLHTDNFYIENTENREYNAVRLCSVSFDDAVTQQQPTRQGGRSVPVCTRSAVVL